MDELDALYDAAIAGDADATCKLEMEPDKLDEKEYTILHTEAKYGNAERVRFILREFANKNLLTKSTTYKRTALHWAIYGGGHTEVVEVLIEAARHLPSSSFQDFLRQGDSTMDTALHLAVGGGYVDIVRLLVEANPTDRHIQNNNGKTPMYIAAERGRNEIVEIICTTCTAPSLDGPGGTTALHAAIHRAKRNDKDVISMIINAAKRSAARHLPSSSANDDNPVTSFQAFLRQGDQDGDTALHEAVKGGNVDIVKLLVEADSTDRHTPNAEGKTPMYIAVERGFNGIAEIICTICTAPSLDGPGGTTALHAAISNIDKAKQIHKDVIRMIINAAKRSSTPQADAPHESFEALFNKTDESGFTILELAVMANHVNVVDLIIVEDPAYKAIDEDFNNIVELLSKTYEVAVYEGAVALILAIKKRDKDTVLRLLHDAKHLATFVYDKGWTPLHYAAFHEFDSVLDAIIELARKDLEYKFIYKDMVHSPLLVAAERGYTSTVIRLMELWPTSSPAYIAVNNDGRNILHLAATGKKKEMIQGILKYCPEKYKDKILKQQDVNGDTPLHLLISHGCYIPELIKHRGLDTMVRNKRKWTPRDMLYSTDDIIADQVKIKIALDDVQTNRSQKFWRKNKKKIDILESLVLPSKRERKDEKFNKDAKSLMDEKRAQMKKDLERYKKRTSTQIVVATLITTVTFTVGFTMPGGLHQSGEVDEGLVVLTKKAAFNAFMVSDALAFLLSTCSLFLYFLESMYEDPHQVSKLNAASVGLNIVSVMAMMLTFITGTYVVLSHSAAIAITVCLIGSFFFVFVIVLLIKMVYDRQVKRNED